jgi:hypothetical protein
MSSEVLSWWVFLCAIGALNVCAWCVSAAVLYRRQANMDLRAYRACRWQLVLSAVYVFGCAFRSALPVFDVPRICLFDTWLSSVIVGRSIATIAEVSFVAQWALLLHETSRITGSVVAKVVSRAVVPLILVAEVCSWYSVLTTSNIGHVLEESIWGFSALLLVFSMIAMRPRCPPNWRPAIVAGCVAGVAYATYMFFVDVPMYWSRWVAEEANGHRYLSIAQGVLDIAERRVVSHRWEDWQSEVVWMTLYFSVAVWISISLVHLLARHMPGQRWFRP